MSFSRRNVNIRKTSIFVFIFMFIGLIVYNVLYFSTSKKTFEATVVNTERITTGSGDDMQHKYLVFTDKGTFENTDELFYTKFNSSDIQGMLKTDSTYTITTLGWRSGFLSMYPNIVKVEP